jgi:murein DD-endopeptidase MepM/ murein hydrolase activator NlpD
MKRALALTGAAALAGCVASRPGTPRPPSPAAPARPAVLVASARLDAPTSQGALVTGSVAPGRRMFLGGQEVPVAADGRFVIGFDRDAPAVATLTEREGAQEAVTALAVAPRAWRIERVDVPYKAGRSDAEFDRLRPAELARIAAARATAVDGDGWRGPWRWPVAGRQSGWFGSQRVYQGKPGPYHGGADIAVPTGTPVRAPADGVVILAADHPFTLEGNLLMLGHGMGVTSALLHLSRILVVPGARVRRGEVVALSGATGRATGPHLHWGVSWGAARLDPLLVAGPVPAR